MVVVRNIITYIFAAILLVFAFYGFYTASKLKGVAGYDRKQISSESLLCILFAVLLILIPIKSVGILLIRVIGVIGILIGIFAIVIEIIAWKNKSDYEVVISDSEDDSPSTQE
jgi:Na+/H+ antiporter NhaC